jgi:2-polyprenyl-6-hydroxyphenyl methylase/3-demethylubiquinone-9 3-methyltransferase
MHETRMLFIKERIINKYQQLGSFRNILSKKKILDLGCGGGILSETLAQEKANIMSIDSSKELIKEAKNRAKLKNLKIDYRCENIKSIKDKNIKFDIILCLEVIEHVEDFKYFIKTAFNCLGRNGIIILSTINKSYLSYITTILLAEKVFKLVPSDTHSWNMYIRPDEILNLADESNLVLDKLKGLAAIPTFNGFKWVRINNTKVNYIISLTN